MDRQKLRDILIEKKAISNFEDPDPFVGIYLEDLCEIVENLVDGHE